MGYYDLETGIYTYRVARFTRKVADAATSVRPTGMVWTRVKPEADPDVIEYETELEGSLSHPQLGLLRWDGLRDNRAPSFRAQFSEHADLICIRDFKFLLPEEAGYIFVNPSGKLSDQIGSPLEVRQRRRISQLTLLVERELLQLESNLQYHSYTNDGSNYSPLAGIIEDIIELRIELRLLREHLKKLNVIGIAASGEKISGFPRRFARYVRRKGDLAVNTVIVASVAGVFHNLRSISGLLSEILLNIMEWIALYFSV